MALRKKLPPSIPRGLSYESLTDLVTDADEAIRRLSHVTAEVFDARSLPASVEDLDLYTLYLNHRRTSRSGYGEYEKAARDLGGVVFYEPGPGSLLWVVSAYEGTRDEEPMLRTGLVSRDAIGVIINAQIDYDGFERICSSVVAFDRYIRTGSYALQMLHS